MEICNPGCSAPRAITAAPTLAPPGCTMADGPREFDEPIPVSKDRQLVTLRDAGDYVAELPETEYMTPEWQAAMLALMLVVELNGPTMMAHRHHESIEPKR